MYIHIEHLYRTYTGIYMYVWTKSSHSHRDLYTCIYRRICIWEALMVYNQCIMCAQRCTYTCIYMYASFHLIRWSVSSTCSCSILMKTINITLVRGYFSFCSQLLRPHSARIFPTYKVFIVVLYNKYILKDYIIAIYVTDYKSILLKLNLFPLMYGLEIQEILFLSRTSRIW